MASKHNGNTSFARSLHVDDVMRMCAKEGHRPVKLFQFLLQTIWTAESEQRPSLADVKVTRMRAASRS
jgi:hypothetical protein